MFFDDYFCHEDIHAIQKSFFDGNLPASGLGLKYFDFKQDRRSWDHRLHKRNLYLTEWMKQNHTKPKDHTAPKRCGGHCQANILLLKIASICAGIEQCLRNRTTFRKYFLQDDSESKELHNNKAISILFTIKTLWDIISDGFYNIYPSRRTSGAISFNSGKIMNEWEKDIQHKANEINKTNSLQISTQRTYLKGIQTEQYEKCDKYAYVRVRSDDKHAECHFGCDNCEKLSKECANLLKEIKHVAVDIEGLKIENKMLKLLLPTHASRSRSYRPLCSARRY